jgi:large subunit ribosomal protein L9
MQNQLLLLDDVDNVGRSGDVVSVRPGFARNFLIPQKKAVVADKFTLKLQARLKEERAQKAEIDKKDALILSEKVANMQLSMIVKVDPDGHMYGSVSATEIVKLLEAENVHIERRNVVLPHPIKELGSHSIQLKLKEGVPATLVLKILSDKPLPKREQQEVQEYSQEENA